MRDPNEIQREWSEALAAYGIMNLQAKDLSKKIEEQEAKLRLLQQEHVQVLVEMNAAAQAQQVEQPVPQEPTQEQK
jgi:hypothetical protein